MAGQLARRDLRNRSAEILREVASGASYEITNHGEVVALLVPAGAERLSVRKATVHRRFGEIPAVERTGSTANVLDELRGES